MQESDHFWRSATGPKEIRGSETHVWRVFLDRPPGSIESFDKILSPDEKSRVEGFHFRKDRESFCICRGFLRSLLGHFTGIGPADIGFSRGEHGKLHLVSSRGHDSLQFNVSHSGRMALFALARGWRVGVDVESIRRVPQQGEIARLFYSEGEARSIQALPEERRSAAFFACWTRKEAAVKALGGSIMELADKVIVSTAPGEPAQLLAMPPGGSEDPEWRLMDLPAGEGYAAALCHEGGEGVLFLWEAREE